MKLQLKPPFWTSNLSGEDQQKKADELSRARGASFIESVNEEIWSIFTDTSTNAISQPFVFNKKQKPVGRLDFRIPIGGGPSPFRDTQASEQAEIAKKKAQKLLKERSGNGRSSYTRAKANMEFAAENQWKRLEEGLKNISIHLNLSKDIIQEYTTYAKETISIQKTQLQTYISYTVYPDTTEATQEYIKAATLRAIETIPVDDKIRDFKRNLREMGILFGEIGKQINATIAVIENARSKEGLPDISNSSKNMVSFRQISNSLKDIPQKIISLADKYEFLEDAIFLKERSFPTHKKQFLNYIKVLGADYDMLARNLE